MKPDTSGRLLAAAIASILLAASASGQTPAPTPAAAGNDAGKALFSKFVASVGGAAKARTLRDVETRGQVTAKTPEGDMTMEIRTDMILPDRLAQQVDAPFGRLVMVATPSGAFVVGPNGSQDLPETMRDELLRQVQRMPLALAQKDGDPGLRTTAAGTEKIGAVETGILDIRYGQMSVRWWVDQKTGRILRSSHTATGPDGKEAKIVSDYSDFRVVDGFPIAHRLEVTTNGERDQTLTLEQVKLNGGVDVKLFEKPPPPPPTTATPAAPPPA